MIFDETIHMFDGFKHTIKVNDYRFTFMYVVNRYGGGVVGMHVQSDELKFQTILEMSKADPFFGAFKSYTSNGMPVREALTAALL